MTTHISRLISFTFSADMNLKSIPGKEGRQKWLGVIGPIALSYLAVILTWSFFADLDRSVFLIYK